MTPWLKQASVLLLTILPFSVFAVVISDPVGDLLATFAPGDDSLHADTDVISS